ASGCGAPPYERPCCISKKRTSGTEHPPAEPHVLLWCPSNRKRGRPRFRQNNLRCPFSGPEKYLLSKRTRGRAPPTQGRETLSGADARNGQANPRGGIPLPQGLAGGKCPHIGCGQ